MRIDLVRLSKQELEKIVAKPLRQVRRSVASGDHARQRTPVCTCRRGHV